MTYSLGSAAKSLLPFCGFAFPFKLDERSNQRDVSRRGSPIVPFERRPRLPRDIRSAGGEFRIHRVAKILCAPLAVDKIRYASDVASAAVPRRKCLEGMVRVADNVLALLASKSRIISKWLRRLL
jgi:hypothetical protein